MDHMLFKSERHAKRMSQREVARRLDVSQPYVAMMESGRRPVRPEYVKALGFSPGLLPVPDDFVLRRVREDYLVQDLAALGYPGYEYLCAGSEAKHPHEVLLTALGQDRLEPRTAEALPWLLLRYWQCDFDWLVQEARRLNLQNRLGFVASLARRYSETSENEERTDQLSNLEAWLDASRLAAEDNFGLSGAALRLALNDRDEDAAHWNVASGLSPRFLSYQDV